MSDIVHNLRPGDLVESNAGFRFTVTDEPAVTVHAEAGLTSPRREKDLRLIERPSPDTVVVRIEREWVERWAKDEPWVPDGEGDLSDYRKAENAVILACREALK